VGAQQRPAGIIGGIGWACAAEYHRLINERIGQRLGVAHSAKIVLFSLDRFDSTSRAAQADPALKAAGADFFMFCAIGAHRFADQLVPRIGPAV
jgi:aspartate racemase